MDDLEGAWEAFWGILLDAWLAFWQWIGGWQLMGPVLVVVLLVGMVLASDSKRERKGRK